MQTYGLKYPLTAFPDRLVVQELFRKELLVAGVTAVFDSAVVDGDSVTLWFSTPIQISDMPPMNSVIGNHRASLDMAKNLRYASIDAKTDAIIARGFTFMDTVLSLSLEAQSSMIGLYALREDPAIVYPIQFNALDDMEAISLVSAEDVRLMCLTAVGTYRGAIDSGSALKNAVRAATTVAEVEAVVDPRA